MRSVRLLAWYELAVAQNTRAIQHYLGHKSINSTVRYTALAPVIQDDAAHAGSELLTPSSICEMKEPRHLRRRQINRMTK
jgi:hypothetical protein